MTKCGFDLERGDTKDNKHIKIEDLKKVTNLLQKNKVSPKNSDTLNFCY